MTPAPGSVDRRFRVVRVVCLVVGVVLAVRLAQVQIFQHGRWRDEAQRQWLQSRVLPARRGDLFDREGRPLALTISNFRVGVSGSLVRNAEALAAVLAEVFGGSTAEQLAALEQQGADYRVLSREVQLDHESQQLLARFPAVNVQEQLGRVYPLDGVGASYIGFSRIDPDSTRHLTGLELGLDQTLAGVEGRAKRVRSGRAGRDHGEVVVSPARHGSHITLTLDADLQEICESRLAEAIERTGSRAGSVLIVDPHHGDVLAAASWPLTPTRRRRVGDAAAWVNRNFSEPYEPGSVFKVFTAAALLTCGAIDTATVYDCADHQFQGFTIREATGHEFGRLNFNQAFTHSSNVWFARSVANIAPREHHRMLLDFGFGRGAGVPYPNEQDGTLHAPSAWSGRTQPTMAIGQEIAATPLQLAMALSAVANGGTLFAPRLIQRVQAADGSQTREQAAQSLRRVIPPELAALLRQAMARVVTDGTGAAVARDWITVAGKTGTAQKAEPGVGYANGLHTATFAGFLPVEQPRLVIVAVLDEPPYRYHYAAQSAAPLFGNVVDDIRQTTRWLDDPQRDGVRVVAPAVSELVPVPDVLFLNAERAAERVRLGALNLSGPLTSGDVVMQVPAPGSLVPRGSMVTLTLHDTTAAGRATCPDLAGLSNRQVLALAARLGLEVTVRGLGYVATQQPAPGQQIPAGGVTVTMEATW